MKISDVSFNLDSKENPSWNYAKTKRILLRKSNCEFSQSVFSAKIENFVFPNRDYTYEGFSAIVGGENWKFLDGIGFALKNQNDEFIELFAKEILITPIDATYFFDFFENEKRKTLKIQYYLLNNSCATLYITASLETDGKNYKLAVKPYCDIRFMYQQSLPENMLIKIENQKILVEKEGKVLAVDFKTKPEYLQPSKNANWTYKLSDGFREINEGKITFKTASRNVLDLGEFDCKFYSNKVEIQFRATIKTDLKGIDNWNEKNDDFKASLLSISRIVKPLNPVIEKAKRKWGEEKSKQICARGIILLEKFELASNPRFEDAGCFWFRNPWMRDVFESIYVNFPLFYLIQKRKVRKYIFHALNLQKNGLIPNKFAETENGQMDYSSIDATLLCFLVAIEYCKRTDDRIIKALLKRSILESINNFRSKQGLVVLNDNGLISCPANYGWVDSIYSEEKTGRKITGRVPKLWSIEDIEKDEIEEKELLNKPYYLVEINAAWMNLLENIWKLSGLNEQWVIELLELVKNSFTQTFISNGKFCHIAKVVEEKSFEGDFFEGNSSSMAIVAATMIPSIADEKFCYNLLADARKNLFTYRNEKLFGITVKNIKSPQPYLDDRQYHQSVVWPRDTPYLIKLIKASGVKDADNLEEQILLSNLEHQMEESTVLYNQELFSLPIGFENGSELKDELVPVKNPAQFWSQWTMPYAQYFDSMNFK